MMHNNRRFHIRRVENPKELGERLSTVYAYTLCSGFELEHQGQRFLFLNDSYTENSIQEYAVVLDGLQVESLTVSWSNAEGLATLVQGVLDGERHQYGACNPGLDYRDHICLLCR